MELGLVIVVALLWFAPIVVAQDMGKKRNRTGWPYGLLLGWLGVLILSLTSYLPSEAERQLREFEARRRLGEVGVEPTKKAGVLESFGFDPR